MVFGTQLQMTELFWKYLMKVCSTVKVALLQTDFPFVQWRKHLPILCLRHYARFFDIQKIDLGTQCCGVWVKPLPTTLASYMGIGSCLSWSTSDPTPCWCARVSSGRRWLKWSGPRTHVRDLNETCGSWFGAGLTPAAVQVWEVNWWIRDLFFSLSLTHSL